PSSPTQRSSDLRELAGRLRPVAERELGFQVKISCPARHDDELVHGDLPQDVARSLCSAHIALDKPAVGPAHTGDGFTRVKMDHLVDVHAGVGLAPPQYR